MDARTHRFYLGSCPWERGSKVIRGLVALGARILIDLLGIAALEARTHRRLAGGGGAAGAGGWPAFPTLP